MSFGADWLKLGWEVLVTVCGLGGGVVGMWATLNFAKREALASHAAAIDKALAAQAERLTKIESDLRHVPTAAAIDELREVINTVNTRLAELIGENRITTRQLERIDEYLREHGK